MTMESEWPADLQRRLREFARERDWEQYHTPRNLAALIASEAGELLALFRWDQDALSEDRQKVEEEVADVLLGLLRFADVAGMDLYPACLNKLARNADKYPADMVGPNPPPRQTPGVVCGIDSGTFKSSSYVAWLRGSEFLLTTYRPAPEDPLPQSPLGWDSPRVYALDLPQGLARAGSKRRVADEGASTPTRVLPANRAALATSQLYKGFIAAGVDTYWSILASGAARIGGLDHDGSSDSPVVVETYPRYVLRMMWPDLKIPSKRQAPEEYTAAVWARLNAKGFRSSPEPARPDHVDAMLCALAARAYLEADGLPPGTVGDPPYIDEDDRVIREGYIVAP
jgi:dCTP diphosphatase